MARLRRAARAIGSHPADVGTAAALAAVAQLEVWAPGPTPGVSETGGPQLLLAATALLATLPLAARRAAPLISGLVAMAGILLGYLLASPPEGLSELAVMLIVAYTIAAESSRAMAALALVALFGVLFVAVQGDPDDAAFVAVLLGATWAAGRAIRASRQRAAELKQLATQLEHEREEKAELAVALERARLARELHDVVAHAVSVMVVHAGGVRGVLRPDQEDERAALAALESTGREAMAELRRMLGILREGGDAGLAPPPRLSQLDRLVDQVRGAGVAVELEVEGDPRPLAPGLELCAYRVVQEALTNVVKHCGGASARVAVRFGDRQLELEITDDGAGPTPAPSRGHGLSGMRERVALYAGRLEAGPGPHGGFRVHARFPAENGRI